MLISLIDWFTNIFQDLFIIFHNRIRRWNHTSRNQFKSTEYYLLNVVSRIALSLWAKKLKLSNNFAANRCHYQYEIERNAKEKKKCRLLPHIQKITKADCKSLNRLLIDVKFITINPFHIWIGSNYEWHCVHNFLIRNCNCNTVNIILLTKWQMTFRWWIKKKMCYWFTQQTHTVNNKLSQVAHFPSHSFTNISCWNDCFGIRWVKLLCSKIQRNYRMWLLHIQQCISMYIVTAYKSVLHAFYVQRVAEISKQWVRCYQLTIEIKTYLFETVQLNKTCESSTAYLDCVTHLETFFLSMKRDCA